MNTVAHQDMELLQEAFAIIDNKSEQVPTREHLVNLHAYYFRKLVKIYEGMRDIQMIVDGPVFNLAAESNHTQKGKAKS